MAQVKIVTDTGADLPRELADKHSIAVVPLRVNFGQESYLDGQEISSTELYEKLVTCKETASTTQPNPQEFAKVYQELTADGSKIVSIHLSGALSGTQQSANIAASMIPEGLVKVVDSRQASIGVGLLVLYAAKLAERGAPQDEIIEAVKAMSSRMSTYFMVDTLEYLQRNGRIG
ncbi:MAG: DegV family protein, partial [Firmicutes bacterium]|nr:DegV family protein [Bacillota bacterium]